LALASVFALTLAFGLPRLLLLLPNSFVILSKEGINNNIVGVGATVRYWPWAEISSCRVSTTTLDGKKFLTLRLIDREGHDLASFGMRDRTLVDEIEGLLTRYGKRLEVDSA
jgi:uncharacterized RDD family membrane protein YckC